ncbi:NERD domain-containing protein [Indiicoccus explosivorum]|uniref:NERD domain-containing protein n=1 Tax=Indiicoccus explosivorum TaxID=1917864 RepID=UPI000B448598|nr:NERD domain-containing protein [Indiicoccus explosivorum]
MAQLIKLQDCVSRYADDLNRYPSQFIRLKREQWLKAKKRLADAGTEEGDGGGAAAESGKLSRFPRWAGWRQQRGALSDDEPEAEAASEESDEQFVPDFVYEPDTEAELKKMFADQLFYFQLKWASSAMSEQSVVHSKYYRDTLLRELLRSLPDSYLMLYRPVLQLKNAPVELDIVLIGPSFCCCVTAVEDEEDAVFSGGTGRFWQKRSQFSEQRFLSPLISLDRTEAVVSRILRQRGIELPVRKVLLSRTGFFDITSPLYGVEVTDKRGAPEWFRKMSAMGGPFKRAQFQAAEALLSTAVTVSYSVKEQQDNHMESPDD